MVDTSTLKLEVSGAISIGMTTLGQALTTRLEFPIIEQQRQRAFTLAPGKHDNQKLRADCMIETVLA